MENNKIYQNPCVRYVSISIEAGYSATGGFEQPEFGGEDNL